MKNLNFPHFSHRMSNLTDEYDWDLIENQLASFGTQCESPLKLKNVYLDKDKSERDLIVMRIVIIVLAVVSIASAFAYLSFRKSMGASIEIHAKSSCDYSICEFIGRINTLFAEFNLRLGSARDYYGRYLAGIGRNALDQVDLFCNATRSMLESNSSATFGLILASNTIQEYFWLCYSSFATLVNVAADAFKSLIAMVHAWIQS
jgi:hypothetical protein